MGSCGTWMNDGSYPAEFMITLKMFRDNGIFCDVNLQNSHVKFKVHKLVFLAASPSLFCLHQEFNTDSEWNIRLPDVEESVLKSVVDYMYTGKLHVKKDTIEDLKLICNKLDIQNAVKLCSVFEDNYAANSKENNMRIINVSWKQKDMKQEVESTTDSGTVAKKKSKDDEYSKQTDSKECDADIKIDMNAGYTSDWQEKKTNLKLFSNKMNHVKIQESFHVDLTIEASLMNLAEQCSSGNIQEPKPLEGIQTLLLKPTKIHLKPDPKPKEKLQKVGNRRKRLAKKRKLSGTDSNIVMKSKNVYIEDEIPSGFEEIGTTDMLDSDLGTGLVSHNENVANDTSKAMCQTKKLKSKLQKSNSTRKKFMRPKVHDNCAQCNSLKKRKKPELLICHIWRTHQQKTVMKCHKCQEDILLRDDNALADHMKEAHYFKCDKCSYACSTNHNLENHKHHRHLDERAHICEVCGSGFKVALMLKRHIAAVHATEKNFLCDQCDYRAPSAKYLREHVRRQHEMEGLRFHCNICGSGFRNRISLGYHVKKAHGSGVITHRCPHCEKGFVDSYPLQKHLSRVHGNKLYYCDCCNKGFRDKHGAREHRRTHTGERPFFCHLCSLTYTEFRALKNHLERNHSFMVESKNAWRGSIGKDNRTKQWEPLDKPNHTVVKDSKATITTANKDKSLEESLDSFKNVKKSSKKLNGRTQKQTKNIHNQEYELNKFLRDSFEHPQSKDTLRMEKNPSVTENRSSEQNCTLQGNISLEQSLVACSVSVEQQLPETDTSVNQTSVNQNCSMSSNSVNEDCPLASNANQNCSIPGNHNIFPSRICLSAVPSVEQVAVSSANPLVTSAHHSVSSANLTVSSAYSCQHQGLNLLSHASALSQNRGRNQLLPSFDTSMHHLENQLPLGLMKNNLGYNLNTDASCICHICYMNCSDPHSLQRHLEISHNFVLQLQSQEAVNYM